MKKKTKLTMIAAVLIAVMSLAMCKTSKGVSPSEVQATISSARISSQAERDGDPYRIVDWKNRSIGEIASPVWLYPATRDNWNLFKSEWSISSDKVLKIGVARHATLNGAQTIADVQYAAQRASELKQSLLSRSGIVLRSDGEFDVVNRIAIETPVDLSGQERLTDFWQSIEATGADGRSTRMYNYYVVYATDSAVWDQLVAKYLFDIVGKLPDTRTQQTIAGMFDEINAETKFEREKTETEWRLEIEAKQRALQGPPKSPAELRAAYTSNDPATRAAAGTTAADADYVAALAALIAASGNKTSDNSGSGTKTGTVVVTNASTFDEDVSVTIRLIRTNDSYTLASQDVRRGNSVTWNELPPGEGLRISVTDSAGNVTSSSYITLSAGQTRNYSYNGTSVY